MIEVMGSPSTEMNESMPTSSEKRAFSVCLRCRTKKVKCDSSEPNCKPCERVQAQCMALDPASGEEIPRNYIRQLQSEVQSLRLRLRLHESVAGDTISSEGRTDTSSSRLPQSHQYNNDSEQDGNSESIAVIPYSIDARHHMDEDESSRSSPLTSMNIDEAFDPLTYAHAVESRDYARPMHKRRRFNQDSRSRRQGDHHATRSHPRISHASNGVKLLNPLSSECDTIYNLYFSRINPQVPVVDRCSFEELMHSLRVDVEAAVDVQITQLMHLVLAVGYATQPDRLLSGAALHALGHFEEADRLELQLRSNLADLPRHSMFGHIPATSTEQQLIQLQCQLLVALYSLMRPVAEGTWSAVATAFQQCIAIGLHDDHGRWIDSSNHKNSSACNEIENQSIPSLQHQKLQEGRRLFWCCYCLDRYVGINMGMPCTLPDEGIRCDLPWTNDAVASSRDASTIRGWSRHTGIGIACRTDIGSNVEQEYLELLESCTASIQADPTRWISIFYIKLRQLQSEIYHMLDEGTDLSSSYPSPAAWMISINDKLNTWYQFAPLSANDLSDLNCHFNPDLLRLNYLQARQLLYSLNLRHTHAGNLDDLETVTLEIILLVVRLEEQGSMHLTWIMLHNLFVSATLHLFCAWQKITTTGIKVYHEKKSDTYVKSKEIKEVGDKLDQCFRSIALRSRAGIRGKQALQSMFATTEQLIRRYEEGAAKKDVRRPWLDRLKQNRLDRDFSASSEDDSIAEDNLPSDTAALEPVSQAPEESASHPLSYPTPSDSASINESTWWGFDLDDFLAMTDGLRQTLGEVDPTISLFNIPTLGG